jgi:PAS domain S-box-containing protein
MATSDNVETLRGPSSAHEQASASRLRSSARFGDELAWNLVDAAPDGIVVVDEAATILLVNRQTEELFGYDRGELLGHSVHDLLPEDLRQVHRAHSTRYRAEPRRRAMGAGNPLVGRRKDGTEVPVEISLSPMRMSDELMVIAVVRDITDRVAVESEAARVRRLLDAARDGVFIFAGDTLRFTYVNEGAVEQVGYDHDELLAMTPLHIAPEFTERDFRALLQPLMEGEINSTQFVTVHRRRDGVDIPVEVMLHVDQSPDTGSARSFVATVRDIRERLEAEERLREAQQELHTLEDHERIARDLHDVVIQQLFASGMTLQGVWSRIGDPEVAQRVATVVDDLDRTIREIRSVIFGLQGFGANSKGCRAAIMDLVRATETGLQCMPRVRFEGPVELIGDTIATQLLATLREALSNIARHAKAATVDVDIAVGDEVVLRVADDGIGIGIGIEDMPSTGHGVRNMSERAARLGGHATVCRRPEGGTLLEWRVPRDAA